MDALQVGGEPTGVGRQAQAIGAALHELPASLQLELRCTRAARDLLAPMFPPSTRISTPLARSRPRGLESSDSRCCSPSGDNHPTLLVCLGDQGPAWGHARVLLVVNDVRRFAYPESSSSLERAYYRRIVPRAIRHATKLVTISEFSRNEIERIFGRPAEVIAHHPPPRVSEPAATPDDGHLLVLGALRRYKGADTVLEALPLLDVSERRGSYSPGPTRTLERRFAGTRWTRASPTGWSFAAGFQTASSTVFATAVATVSPSRYEGYGLSVAEVSRGGAHHRDVDRTASRDRGDALLTFPAGDPGGTRSAPRPVARQRPTNCAGATGPRTLA